MKLQVPYVQHEDSGTACIKMACDYFKKFKYLEDVEALVGKSQSQALHTMNLAIAARKLGFQIQMYTKKLEVHEDIENYSGTVEDSKDKVEQAKELGVEIEQKQLFWEDIKKWMNKLFVPMVLVNMDIFRRKKGYDPQYILVVGYEEDYVLIHNPLDTEFIKVKQDKFDDARQDKRTYEDIFFLG